ncbi:MAG: hypothetical protein RR880_04290, partial [Bacteroidales bacterium]
MSLTFTDRHIGPRENDIKEMLKVLNINSLEELATQTVPADVLLKTEMDLSPAVTENEYLANLKEMVS